MTNDEKFNKVVEIMQRAELEPRAEENIRVFLLSLIDAPEFDNLIAVLEKNPDVFDDFSAAFLLKQRFLEFGASEKDVAYLLEKEKDLIARLGQNNK